MSCFTSSKIIFPNIIKQKNPRSAFHEKPWCFGLGWCGPHSSKMDRIGTFFPLEIRQPPIRRTFHTHPEMIFSHLCTKFCFGLKIFGLLTCYSPILWEWFLFGVFFLFSSESEDRNCFQKRFFRHDQGSFSAASLALCTGWSTKICFLIQVKQWNLWCRRSDRIRYAWNPQSIHYVRAILEISQINK